MRANGPGTLAPALSDVGHGVAKRVLLPAVVLWLAVMGVGYLLVHVIAIDEYRLSQAAVDLRTDTWNSITTFVSSMGDTQVLSATCLVIVLLLWSLSRQWWFAIVPAISLAVQVSVFLTTSLLVGRERPDVDQLDSAPPTSRFPSGHTGATSSVYFAVALCATRIQSAWLRIAVQALCVLIPIGVALSRVYRGMHHPTDVAAGLLIGATCAIIAWNWLPRRDTQATAAGAIGV